MNAAAWEPAPRPRAADPLDGDPLLRDERVRAWLLHRLPARPAACARVGGPGTAGGADAAGEAVFFVRVALRPRAVAVGEVGGPPTPHALAGVRYAVVAHPQADASVLEAAADAARRPATCRKIAVDLSSGGVLDVAQFVWMADGGLVVVRALLRASSSSDPPGSPPAFVARVFVYPPSTADSPLPPPDVCMVLEDAATVSGLTIRPVRQPSGNEEAIAERAVAMGAWNARVAAIGTGAGAGAKARWFRGVGENGRMEACGPPAGVGDSVLAGLRLPEEAYAAAGVLHAPNPRTHPSLLPPAVASSVHPLPPTPLSAPPIFTSSPLPHPSPRGPLSTPSLPPPQLPSPPPPPRAPRVAGLKREWHAAELHSAPPARGVRAVPVRGRASVGVAYGAAPTRESDCAGGAFGASGTKIPVPNIQSLISAIPGGAPPAFGQFRAGTALAREPVGPMEPDPRDATGPGLVLTGYAHAVESYAADYSAPGVLERVPELDAAPLAASDGAGGGAQIDVIPRGGDADDPPPPPPPPPPPFEGEPAGSPPETAGGRMSATRPAHLMPQVEQYMTTDAEGVPMCKECDAKFEKRGNLQRHVLHVHFKHKPFRCPHCSALFGYRTHLLRHENTVHRKDRDKEPRRRAGGQ